MSKCQIFWSVLIFLHFKISSLQYLPPDVSLENEHGKLVHVSVLFRHGDRSPYSWYPKDPYLTYPWRNGLGQLTIAGERHMYDVGKWYRQRYFHLTKQILSHTNISVRSSDRDRTIMSAQCFMAAFYPPEDGQFLNTSLRWQPIPIHTIPLKYDNILVVSSENECPMIYDNQKKFFNSKSAKEIYDKYEKPFRFLRDHTGYTFPRNDVLQSVTENDRVYDTLLVERENNLTLPFWTQEVFPRPLLTIKESLKYKPAEFYPILKRLIAGPFLKSVVSNMLGKSRNRTKTIFNFYASHDDFITHVSMALDFYDNTSPPYGSGLIFELRRKGSTHTVSVFFANSTTSAPYRLAMPNCRAPCTLENFIEFTRPLIPDDWRFECKRKKRVIRQTLKLKEQTTTNFFEFTWQLKKSPAEKL